MRRAISLLVLLVALVSGCSIYHVDSQDTTLDFFPPKSSVDKVVYLDKVDRAHEVIAIVTVTTERTRPLEEIIDQMRAEAAILGGDAVTDIRTGEGAEAGDGQGAGLFTRTSVRLRYMAKVVAFK